MPSWMPIVSLVVSVLSGPIVLAAVSAVHERNTARLINDALEKERERSKELFALKHEVSEMKGHVMQLVANSAAVDGKLERISELLLDMSRHR